jgi:hypothetical protein
MREAARDQDAHLFLGFNAFGNDAHVQRMSKANNRLHNCFGSARCSDLINERLIDLDLVECEALEVAQ